MVHIRSPAHSIRASTSSAAAGGRLRPGRLRRGVGRPRRPDHRVRGGSRPAGSAAGPVPGRPAGRGARARGADRCRRRLRGGGRLQRARARAGRPRRAPRVRRAAPPGRPSGPDRAGDSRADQQVRPADRPSAAVPRRPTGGPADPGRARCAAAALPQCARHARLARRDAAAADDADRRAGAAGLGRCCGAGRQAGGANVAASLRPVAVRRGRPTLTSPMPERVDQSNRRDGTEPAEVAQPAEAAELAEATAPAGPGETAGTAGPAEAAAPAGTAGTADLAEATAPAGPGETAGTAGPAEAAAPAGTAGTAEPAEAAAPAAQPSRWASAPTVALAVATWLVVAAGVALRMRQWLFNRPLWTDELLLYRSTHGQTFRSLRSEEHTS